MNPQRPIQPQYQQQPQPIQPQLQQFHPQSQLNHYPSHQLLPQPQLLQPQLIQHQIHQQYQPQYQPQYQQLYPQQYQLPQQQQQQQQQQLTPLIQQQHVLQPSIPQQQQQLQQQQLLQQPQMVQASSSSIEEAKRFLQSTNAWCDDDTPPQPPPRRRFTFNNHVSPMNKFPPTREQQSAFYLVNSETKSNVNPLYPNGQHDKLKEIHELAFKSPGRVKEHAQKLNKMVSESELKPPMPVNSPPTPVVKTSSGRSSKCPSKDEDNDSASVQPFDPLRRKWMITTSNCDYAEMVSLLKKDATLAGLKDFTSGYTALHWAAKFGKPEIIKLIAGTHGVSVNKKTHGGYTPLHLAAIHNHENIVELLKIYGADTSLRDHSGKLAEQYLSIRSPLRSSNGNLSGGLLRSKASNGSLNGSQRKMFITSEDYNNNNASTPNLSALSPTSSTSPLSPVSRASSLTRNRNRIRQAHRNLFGKIPTQYKTLKF